MEKMTKIEMLKTLSDIVTTSCNAKLIDQDTNDSLVSWLNSQIEIINRQSKRRKEVNRKKNNHKNASIREAIMETLSQAENPLPVSDMRRISPELNSYTTQKIVGVLKQMWDSGEIKRIATLIGGTDQMIYSYTIRA